jgi:hypothetical protein
VEDDVVALAVLLYVMRGAPEQYPERLRLLEDVLGERAERPQAEHLAVEEPRGQDRDGVERLFDRPHVPRLRIVPAREVRVAHGLGQEPVDHEGVHAVVVEVEVRIGAAGLRNDHLLGVEHQPHRSAFAVGQDLLNARDGFVESLSCGEDAVFG